MGIFLIIIGILFLLVFFAILYFAILNPEELDGWRVVLIVLMGLAGIGEVYWGIKFLQNPNRSIVTGDIKQEKNENPKLTKSDWYFWLGIIFIVLFIVLMLYAVSTVGSGAEYWESRAPLGLSLLFMFVGIALIIHGLKTHETQTPLAQQSTIYQGDPVIPSSDSSIITQQDLDDNFARFSPRDMEFLVGELFKKKGYDVSVTQSTADRAIDVWAKNNNMEQLLGIEVKKHHGNVGSRDVAASLGQGKSRANKVIVISTISDFTKEAYVILGDNEFLLELWNGAKFRQEVSTHLLNNNTGTSGTLPKGY